MAIELSKQTRERLIESIQRYFSERLDEEIGQLKASLLLEFVVAEIGPAIYNQAVGDAQAFLLERVADLPGTCHEPDQGYWKR